MKQIVFLLATFTIFHSANGYAYESNLDAGNYLLVGGDLFYQTKDDTDSPEVDNNGFGIGLKGVFSKYWESWIADIGLGYRYDTMDDNVEVETKAFFLEAGARYRLNKAWSIGPQLHVLMGTDVSFSDVGTNSDDKSSATFLGVRLLHNQYVGEKRHILRLGAQALTDMNLNDRKVTYLQFVLEYGWPCDSKSKPLPPEPAKVVAKQKVEPKLKLDLRNAGVNFDSGGAELKGRAQQVIDSLAKVLTKYSNEWDSVRIEGHTDITGNYKKNVDLSKSRAAAVVSRLVDQGVDSNKLSSEGFGPDQPLDSGKNKAAYAKNRRVELHLMGDNASAAFVKELRQVLE